MTEGAIVRLRPGHEEALARLFAEIAGDPSGRSFHPHPFTPEHARSICGHPGRDLYFGARDTSGHFVAYGMLRGWDAGHSIPSLGIYVLPRARGSGVARRMMEHLHEAARDAGAARIRLKVYPDNVAARRLYDSMGYRSAPGAESGQLVCFKDLEPRCV